MTQHMEEERVAKLAREVERSAFKKDAIAACSTVDFRARSPGEIGEQLLRDAQSLELTGASFEKDEAFYRNVAANVREAAAFLGQWHDLIEAMQSEAAIRERTARVSGLLQANRIAETVAALVPAKHVEGPAVTWRQSASAVGAAILAVADSLTVLPEVRT